MSQSQSPDDTSEQPNDETTATEKTDLKEEIQRLKEENARLRSQYAETQRASFHQEALGLATVGIIAAILGFIFTTAQDVLLSIAAIGLFAAVLTWFLTPEQFIPANIGRDVFEPLSQNGDAISAQLGLSSTQVYLITEDGPRLFVPKRDSYELPSTDALTHPFVIGDDEFTTGISLRPSASRLLNEFEETHQMALSDDPQELASQVSVGLSEGLELTGHIGVDIDISEGRATFEITSQQFGPSSQFDHPVRSFLALGMTRGLGLPVEAEWVTNEDGNATVTVRWDHEEMTSSPP